MPTLPEGMQAIDGGPSVREILNWARATLDATDTPELDARLLLSDVLGWPTSRVWAYPDATVPHQSAAHFRSLVARRAGGEPVAYLLGEAHFHDIVLKVTPATLVPRPETELLVERALAALPDGPKRVADLGTGSGAVALVLAKARPDWQIIAVDVSLAALTIAKINRDRLGTPNVALIAGDWDGPLTDRSLDMIVANPPYVAADDPHLGALCYEPQSALVSGPAGLDAIGDIIASSPRVLSEGGWLLCEHGADHGAQVRGQMAAFGYHGVQTWQDMAGHDRVTGGIRPTTDGTAGETR